MDQMTTEMKRAMARYEEARASYRRAVLASFDGKSKGETIRRALVEFRVAQRELKRLGPPPIPRAAPSVESAEEEASLLPGLGFFRRLLSAS